MMLDIIRFVLSAVLTLGGLFCLLSAVVGVNKFRYALSRIHAAALIDTVGILLMLLGVIVATGFTFTSAKILIVIAFLTSSSPATSSNLIFGISALFHFFISSSSSVDSFFSTLTGFLFKFSDIVTRRRALSILTSLSLPWLCFAICIMVSLASRKFLFANATLPFSFASLPFFM